MFLYNHVHQIQFEYTNWYWIYDIWCVTIHYFVNSYHFFVNYVYGKIVILLFQDILKWFFLNNVCKKISWIVVWICLQCFQQTLRYISRLIKFSCESYHHLWQMVIFTNTHAHDHECPSEFDISILLFANSFLFPNNHEWIWNISRACMIRVRGEWALIWAKLMSRHVLRLLGLLCESQA